MPRSRSSRRGSTRAASLLALLSLLLSASAASLQAILDRDQASVGQRIGFQLVLQDAELAVPPSLPAVDGLRIQSRGVSRQYQWVNGVDRRSTRYAYEIVAEREGEFTLPAIEVRVGSQTLRSEPLTLTIGAPTAPEAAAEARLGRLEVEFAHSERNHLWVGELTPVRIKALFPAGIQIARLRSQLSLVGTDWTIHGLGTEPKQDREIIDGKEYFTLTWYAGIAPLRAGAEPPLFELPLTVEVPREDGDSSFGDHDLLARSLMIRMLQDTEERDLDLRATPAGAPRAVRDLPAAGRPADFSGLIGQFRIDQARRESNQPVTVGEPFSLTARVSGNGNFPLLDPPRPSTPDDWRSYDGEDQFRAGDQTGTTGAKDFRWTLAARRAGTQQLTLQLDYFDPETGQYAQASAPPIPVEVTGSVPLPAAPTLAPIPAPTPAAPADSPQPGLSLALHPGIPATLVAWSSRPAFYPALGSVGAATLALAGLALARRQRQRGDAPARRQRSLELRRSLHRADQAARHGDSARFLDAARTHLGRLLSPVGQPPEAVVTAADLRAARLDDPTLQELLRAADARDYSGLAVDPDSLQRWLEALRSAADPHAR